MNENGVKTELEWVPSFRARNYAAIAKKFLPAVSLVRPSA
jgi:hypothetical protein